MSDFWKRQRDTFGDKVDLGSCLVACGVVLAGLGYMTWKAPEVWLILLGVPLVFTLGFWAIGTVASWVGLDYNKLWGL